MDTFFATKKGGQSSRGLFVTYKGFIYVVPIVGSPQVSFSNVHFRNTTRIAVQVLLLLTLFTFTFEPFLKL